MTPRRALSCLAAATLAASLAACHRAESDDAPAPPPAATQANAETTARFTVRGQVVALSEDAITIRNEAIPEYPKGPDGDPGLDPINRAYPLNPALDTHTLAEGDPVEFTFSIPEDNPEAPTLLAIAELPESHKLDFTALPRTYHTRGLIVRLPREDEPYLIIRHEAIPEFRAAYGKLGMDVMPMTFPVAEGVSLDGLAVGQPVAFAFRVDYKADHVPEWYEVTHIEPLESADVLDFTPLAG